MSPYKNESMFEAYVELQQRLRMPKPGIAVPKFDLSQFKVIRLNTSNDIINGFRELRPFLEGKYEETKIADDIVQCFDSFKGIDPGSDPQGAYDCLVPLGEYVLWLPVITSGRFASDPFTMVLTAYLYSTLLLLQHISRSSLGSASALSCLDPIQHITAELKRMVEIPASDRGASMKALELMHLPLQIVKNYRSTYGLSENESVL